MPVVHKGHGQHIHKFFLKEKPINIDRKIERFMGDDDQLYYNYDLAEEKGYTQFVKYIERVVRFSPEYKVWANWAKFEMNHDYECPICGVSNTYIPIETHHTTTLFDIVAVEIDKLIYTNEIDKISPIQICQNIIDKHLSNDVKFVNICKTCHLIYHNGEMEMSRKIKDLFKDQYSHLFEMEKNNKINT